MKLPKLLLTGLALLLSSCVTDDDAIKEAALRIGLEAIRVGEEIALAELEPALPKGEGGIEPGFGEK
jgi:starvation-inducible outer membrane lipoprotein